MAVTNLLTHFITEHFPAVFAYAGHTPQLVFHYFRYCWVSQNGSQSLTALPAQFWQEGKEHELQMGAEAEVQASGDCPVSISCYPRAQRGKKVKKKVNILL